MDEETAEVHYFECANCKLREKYEYFGKDPAFLKHYTINEDAYIIEDPFVQPKQREFIVLGAHCVKCNLSVCKDIECSVYYNGTYCINCAKKCITTFPSAFQDKINRIKIS